MNINQRQETIKSIKVSGMIIDEIDKYTMIDAIMSGEVSYGKYNEMAENELKKYTGREYSLLVNSGSSANLLALSCFKSSLMYDKWRLQEGDAILTLACGFPTTIAPIIQLGCVPIFLDITEDLRVNIEQMKYFLENQTKKIKGVIFAHTLGIPFDIMAVQEFCEKYNLFFIGDCCDAFGSRYNGKPVESYGDVTTHSYYPAHMVTSGEGGSVFTSDPLFYKILKSLRDWGRNCECNPGQNNKCGERFNKQYPEGIMGKLPDGYDHKYVYSHLGYNLKMTNVQAALLYSQIKNHLEDFIEKRKINFRLLDVVLHEFSPFRNINLYEGLRYNPAFFGYPILLPDELNREEIIRKINKRGIDTRLLFAGNILSQPCSIEIKDCTYLSLDITNKIMNQLFWIGLWPGLFEEDIVYERNEVSRILKEEMNK